MNVAAFVTVILLCVTLCASKYLYIWLLLTGAQLYLLRKEMR